MKSKLLLLHLCLINSNLFCQVNNNQNWTTNLQNPKEFIENKGQFNEVIKSSNEVILGTNLGAIQLYFTKKGITYRLDEYEHSKEDLSSSKKSEKELEHELENKKTKTFFMEMNWVGSNPNVQIIKEKEVSNYYTYPNFKDTSGKTGIKANAFKKITYKNLYPNIDVEYIFQTDKEEYKYNIILYPGADPSVVKMNFSNSAKIKINDKGSLTYKISDEQLIDLTPVTYYEDNTPISSNYVLENNTVGFNLKNHDSSKKTIIDPWSINPNFTVFNRGFDVDYDNSGNVYVSGGINYTSSSVVGTVLKKFTNSGTLIWTYSVPIGGNIGTTTYADFAVNHSTGEVFIIQEFSNYPQIGKLNSSGLINTTFEMPVINTNYGHLELIRIFYNQCTDQVIVTLGNCVANSLTFNEMILTSMLTTPVFKTSITQRTDCGTACINNDGTNYYSFGQKSGYYSTPTNQLFGAPISNLATPLFNVNSGYNLSEGSSIAYSSNVSGKMMSHNGIGMLKKYLYTSDGYTVKKWDPTSGIIIGTMVLAPTVSQPEPFYPTLFNTRVSWGGIDVDQCENVYVGFKKSIKVYDSNFNLINTINVADTVYDINLSDDYKMYVSGNSMLSQIDLTPPTIILGHTNATGCGTCDGTAYFTGLCPSGIDNFDYSWNTTPVQTNDTAFNLCPGTYTLTIRTKGCNPTIIYTGDVTIEGLSGAAIMTTISSTPKNCNTNDGTVTITVTGGATPYSFTWNSTPPQTSSTAVNLPAGMIICTITDAAGCIKTDSVTVTNLSTIASSISATIEDCVTNIGTATILVTGGNPTYTYLWSNGDTTPTISAINGSYSVTVTDQSGCIIIDSITIDPPIIPSTTAGSNSAICMGETLNLTASNSSIIGCTYNWVGPDNFSSILQNPIIPTSTLLSNGIYTVTITANGCSSTSTVTVLVKPIPTNIASDTSPICTGETLYLTCTTNSTSPMFNWTGPSFSSTIQNPSIQNCAINATGDYIVTVTENGCSLQDTVHVIINQKPNASVTANSPICVGETLLLNAVSDPNSLFNWTGSADFTSTLQNPQILSVQLVNEGKYVVVVTNLNGCFDSDSINIVIHVIPEINFTADILKGCSPLEVTFTNLTTPLSNSVIWDFDDGSTTSNTGNITHTYTNSGTYSISLFSTVAGCSNTLIQPQMIEIFDNANANFTVNPTTASVTDPLFTLTNLSTKASIYSWDFGDNSISNLTNPTHTYLPEAGTFEIQLIANNENNCPDTTELTVIIIEPLIFYVPNTFTPDADNFNEVFIPIMTSGFDPNSFEMKIFNRWGELIFKTIDSSVGWNGTYNGEKAQDGTYTWVIEFKDKNNDKKYYHNGHVNLLR